MDLVQYGGENLFSVCHVIELIVPNVDVDVGHQWSFIRVRVFADPGVSGVARVYILIVEYDDEVGV